MTINPTAVWRVRPLGNNANGGGYDAGISGAGTDYSQQNSAQASGTHGANSGTTFTDSTANAFTSAMVGNAICIGAAGFFFVVGYTSASTVTLDRSPGSLSAQTWALGGAWADFWTNTINSPPIVPGNIVYIFGSGTVRPNPASYSYDYTPSNYFVPAGGSSGAGNVMYAKDPAMPAAAYPVISHPNAMFYQCNYVVFKSLWCVRNNNTNGGVGSFHASTTSLAMDCVVDQAGYDVSGFVGPLSVMGGAVFSSTTGSAGSAWAIQTGQYGTTIDGVSVFKCIGNGIYCDNIGHVTNCLIAQNNGAGLYMTNGGNDTFRMMAANNTIDGNGGDGVILTASILATCVWNNLITNHTGSGKYGMNASSGTAAQNDLIKQFIDYNHYYGNTTNFNDISAGAHDTVGVDPQYTSRSTGDYSIGANLKATGFPLSFAWN